MTTGVSANIVSCCASSTYFVWHSAGFVQKWISIKGTNLSCSEIIRRGYNPDAAINLIYIKDTQEEIAINILGQIRQGRKNGETIDYNLSILFYY